ncbi:MAG: amidohydrolase, partial [Candidatus Marinimicrobia bacterium]|nr:amidohydrolase [Candidatus Neomarinimicrobiota bacterium]
MSILIKGVLLNQDRTDIYIENDRFTTIAPGLERFADTVIDGSRFAVLPAFYNLHTHSAMTLMRGYADDIELHSWLTDHIWPLEKNLTEDHVYHGARLAALEMIKSGTVFFNDMYFFPHGTARAADELGMRADIAPVLIDGNDPAKADDLIAFAKETIERSSDYSPRVRFAVSPHAIYSGSARLLTRCAELARAKALPLQIHVSETLTEVADSLRQFGMRPVQYLDSLGFLGPNLTAVHAVHLDDTDRSLLKERGVTIAHCPSSNMKLSSGSFDYAAARAAGIPFVIATDGACSNNNLSMMEEMKIASLRAKDRSSDPTVAPAREIFDRTTVHAAKAAGLNAGRIEEGMLADCLLVRLDHPTLTPPGHLISHMVYSAHPECIDTVICDGRILMRGRKVEGEEVII